MSDTQHMPVLTTDHPVKQSCIAVDQHEPPFVAPDLILAYATHESIAAWYKTICEHARDTQSITIDARGTSEVHTNHHLVDCYLTWFVVARESLSPSRTTTITVRISTADEFPFCKKPVQSLSQYHTPAKVFASAPFTDTNVFSALIFRVEQFPRGSPPPPRVYTSSIHTRMT